MHVAQVGESSRYTRTRPASSLNTVRRGSIPRMLWTMGTSEADPTPSRVIESPESLCAQRGKDHHHAHQSGREQSPEEQPPTPFARHVPPRRSLAPIMLPGGL